MAAVGACAGFGAICGSSLATAATMGQVALPELKRAGYSGGIATACLAAGGTLGILIPPSVVLVIYAILTEQNIAKLFLAAFVPGLLAAVGYMIVIAVYARLKPEEVGTMAPMPMKERWAATVKVWPVLVIFISVVGGIYTGLFTPTEGAAIGAFGTGLSAWFSGGLNRKTFKGAVLGTAMATGMIFMIVLGGRCLQHLPGLVATAAGGRQCGGLLGRESHGGADRHPAAVCGAGLFHGLPVHDPADHPGVLPHRDRAGFRACRPKSSRSGLAFWC